MGSLTILTDNQALVKALANPVTDCKTIKNLKQTLNTFGAHMEIGVRWIKAHVGHYGNELADNLAKQGAGNPPIGPEPHYPVNKKTITGMVLSKLTDAWSTRWKNRNDARQTGILFPSLKLNNSKQILKLPKNKIGPLVRALTGHDFGTRHKAILEKVSPPSCSFCWTEEESFSHLLLSCPSFNNTRADIFGSYTADIIHSWTTEQVVSFLSVQSITDREA